MTEKISRGEPVVPPPFGYKMGDNVYLKDTESGAADIVKEVFERYAAGERQRALAMWLGDKGVRTKYGKRPDNRMVDYMLHNPAYIGKLRYSTGGIRAVSKKDYENENIMVVDGHHEPIISMELWEKVQKLLAEQKRQFPKYARREQPIEYMLKGLVRCGACGGTLVMSSATSGKAKIRTMQCHNYGRGQCTVSHSVIIPRLNAALLAGLEKAVGEKQFVFAPERPKKAAPSDVDYDKLIAVEERRLARAREAYLAEIDTLEQYKKHKDEVTARIEDLKKKRDKGNVERISPDIFAKKVSGVLEFVKRDDVTETAKNEALRTVIETMIYEKAKGNLAIYFHDI
jgi:hypothetical protein